MEFKPKHCLLFCRSQILVDGLRSKSDKVQKITKKSQGIYILIIYDDVFRFYAERIFNRFVQEHTHCKNMKLNLGCIVYYTSKFGCNYFFKIKSCFYDLPLAAKLARVPDATKHHIIFMSSDKHDVKLQRHCQEYSYFSLLLILQRLFGNSEYMLQMIFFKLRYIFT